MVGLLMPRTARLELDLASPEELADAVGVGVEDGVALSKEFIGLGYGGDLAALHGLLQILEGLFGDQLLLAASLAHPAP